MHTEHGLLGRVTISPVGFVPAKPEDGLGGAGHVLIGRIWLPSLKDHTSFRPLALAPKVIQRLRTLKKRSEEQRCMRWYERMKIFQNQINELLFSENASEETLTTVVRSTTNDCIIDFPRGFLKQCDFRLLGTGLLLHTGKPYFFDSFCKDIEPAIKVSAEVALSNTKAYIKLSFEEARDEIGFVEIK